MAASDLNIKVLIDIQKLKKLQEIADAYTKENKQTDKRTDNNKIDKFEMDGVPKSDAMDGQGTGVSKCLSQTKSEPDTLHNLYIQKLKNKPLENEEEDRWWELH